MPRRTRLRGNPSGLEAPARGSCESASFDREVVELDDRVRLGPETHFAGVLECVVGRIEDFRPIEPDHKVTSGGLELQRVPGVFGYLDRFVLERSPAPLDGMVDRAVVLVRV